MMRGSARLTDSDLWANPSPCQPITRHSEKIRGGLEKPYPFVLLPSSEWCTYDIISPGFGKMCSSTGAHPFNDADETQNKKK